MTDQVNEAKIARAIAHMEMAIDAQVGSRVTLHRTRAREVLAALQAAQRLATHPSRGVVDEKTLTALRDMHSQEVTGASGFLSDEANAYHAANRDALAAAIAALQAAALPAVPPDADDSMVVIETVGLVREREDGSRYIDWTLEGGIHGMEVGDELTATSRQVTNDEGYGEVYQRPQAALPAVPEDTEWREAFVEVSASRYRDAGMKIEAARIHAEVDANQLEIIWRAKKAATPAHDQPEGEG